ncbi:unnamed protein product [Choristocarpus tenellus]
MKPGTSMKLVSCWGLDPIVVSNGCGSSLCSDPEEDEPTGKTLWDATQVLYNIIAAPETDNPCSVTAQRVIELGAGTGALGVGMVRAGAVEVVCTDLPCHLGRIQGTAKANGAEYSVEVDVLRWGGDVSHLNPPFDVIVMSEVLYWPALDLLQEDTLEPLATTLVDLSRCGTRVMLAYKER